MSEFTFYFEEHIGGNKYKQTICAENFRAARDEFFNQHCPHRIDAIWNETANKKLL